MVRRARTDAQATPRSGLRRSRTIERVPVQTETFQVTGIRCERCVLRLGGVLGRLEGLEAANANLMGQVVVSWDDERLERVTIVETLAGAGFRAAVVQDKF